ncbi:MAG: methionyl-tRNA formyltransferase [Saprospiraceae bacterium]
MRIVFFGTPEFAVASLQALVEHDFEVVAVVTSTDKLGGRGGKTLLESPVKKYASSQDIPVLQPDNLKSPEFLNQLESYHADVQFVVAFRMLPVVVWDMPKLGTFNLHGSLLPKYRGAAPINWAVINGEKETGVTTFKLKHAIDTGDIALQATMPISEEDNAGTVHDKMMVLGANLIVQTAKALQNNTLTFTPQSDAKSCPAPKLFHDNTKIDFNYLASEVNNFIRGLSPYPSAWTDFEGSEVKILKSKVVYEAAMDVMPGEIDITKRHFKIACADYWLEILELKPEGKRQMNVQDFLNGRQS